MRARIVESRELAGHTYEVRREGAATCLYTDGVLHTRFDPAKPIAGRVWDLLALPAFAEPPRRALVLGVGGGAVIRLLLAFAAPEVIDGVDLDGVHLDVARRHFGLEDPCVRLHQADARAFATRAKGTYDFVLEDVFGGTRGVPSRAIPLDDAWAETLLARLARDGVLVVNHACEAEVRASVLADRAFLGRFASVLALTTPSASNVVLALFRRPVTPHALRQKARATLGPFAEALDVAIRTRA